MRWPVPRVAVNGPRSGLGLGLSFVAWIVKAHQGTIDVDTSPGFGTRFTVRLPVEANEQTAAELTTKPVVPSGKRQGSRRSSRREYVSPSSLAPQFFRYRDRANLDRDRAGFEIVLIDHDISETFRDHVPMNRDLVADDNRSGFNYLTRWNDYRPCVVEPSLHSFDYFAFHNITGIIASTALFFKDLALRLPVYLVS
jgi:hypothetical protein